MKEIIKMKRRIRRNCIICEKKNNRSGVQCLKSKRYITCSKDCSKKYMRINNYLTSSYVYKIKKLETKIKELKNE